MYACARPRRSRGALAERAKRAKRGLYLIPLFYLDRRRPRCRAGAWDLEASGAP